MMPPARRPDALSKGRRPPPALVVQVHGAGPRLEGFTHNVATLAAALGPETRTLVYDAARPVRFIRRTTGLLGDSLFGYHPDDLARVAYDWETPERIAEDVESQLARRGSEQIVVLVGHSMGAAAAVHAVELLAAGGRGADDLLLLDRMFFEWRITAFFGWIDRRVRLTERGARRIGALHEVLVPGASLTARERIWLATPSGGHRPVPPELDAFPGRVIREFAPAEYGHASVVWWEAPFRRIAARWRASGSEQESPINVARSPSSEDRPTLQPPG